MYRVKLCKLVISNHNMILKRILCQSVVLVWHVDWVTKMTKIVFAIQVYIKIYFTILFFNYYQGNPILTYIYIFVIIVTNQHPKHLWFKLLKQK